MKEKMGLWTENGEESSPRKKRKNNVMRQRER